MKDTIRKEFERLVVEKQNLKFNIQDICDGSCISRQTFYRYYRDKYEIIEEIVRYDLVDPLYPLMDNRVEPVDILENWYITLLKKKSFYTIIMKEQGQNSFFESLIKYIYELELVCLKQQNINDEQDLDYLAYKFASMQAMLLKKWFPKMENFNGQLKKYQVTITDLLEENRKLEERVHNSEDGKVKNRLEKAKLESELHDVQRILERIPPDILRELKKEKTLEQKRQR